MENKLSFGKGETAIVKGVAILLMFIHHLFAETIEADYYSQDFFDTLSVIGKICVSIYSFISGYGIYCSYEKGNSFNVGKRILGLYVNYWIIMLLFYLPMQIISGDFTFTVSNILNYVLNLTSISTSLNPNAWFIRNWTVFIILSPFMFKLLKKLSNITVEVLLFIILPVVISVLWNNYFLLPLPGIAYYFVNELLFSFFVMMPFFTIGFIMARHKVLDKLFSVLEARVNRWVLVALSIAILVSVYFIPINLCYIYGIYYSYLIVTPILIIVFVILVNKLNINIVNKTMSFLGKHSNNMWLVHGAFYVGVFQTILYLPKYPIFILLFLIAITIVASVITEKLAKLINSKIYKINKINGKILHATN